MIKNQFKDKSVLVTGGTGSFGEEIVRKVLDQKPKKVRIYARNEYGHWLLRKKLEKKYPSHLFENIIGDVRNRELLDFASKDVDIIFHAAALKHITHAEENIEETISINVEGAKCVLKSALKNNVKKVVAISTDKAVYPNTIMGISKLLMERLFVANWSRHNSNTVFFVVRMGNIINSKGSVVSEWINAARKGEPLLVTDKKMKRYFISVNSAVDFIFDACSIAQGREIFIPKMRKIKIYNLAEKISNKYEEKEKLKIDITSAREREKLNESLFTSEERKLMIEKRLFFIVFPNKELFKKRKNNYNKNDI